VSFQVLQSLLPIDVQKHNPRPEPGGLLGAAGTQAARQVPASCKEDIRILGDVSQGILDDWHRSASVLAKFFGESTVSLCAGGEGNLALGR
jgi:hypothetical protein